MPKIVMNLVVVAAVAGWVAAFLSMNESRDLEDRLAAAKVGLFEAKEQLADAQGELAQQQSAAGDLKDIDERMAAKQAEAAALAEDIEAKRRELGTLQQDLDSGKLVLSTLADRIAANQSALSRLIQDREVAKAELDRLRAESERQPEAASGIGAEPPAAAAAIPKVAIPATATPTPTPTPAAVTPASDSLADARRRFARIDQNGDGRIDRLDLRLKRVSLFGMVDANEDNYLTPDETLLSPEAFQKFDFDGDGRISSFELADRRSFSVMDSDGDEFVTFEEYAKFLRVNPE